MKTKEILKFLEIILVIIAIFLSITGEKNFFFIIIAAVSLIYAGSCIPYMLKTIREKSDMDTVAAGLLLIVLVISSIYMIDNIFDIIKGTREEMSIIPICLYSIFCNYYKEIKLKKE